MNLKEAQEQITALNFLLLEQQDTINALSAERDKLREALDSLWKVKQYKDNNGKDEFYEMRQPQAWALAEVALETCPKQPKEAISATISPNGAQDKGTMDYSAENKGKNENGK